MDSVEGNVPTYDEAFPSLGKAAAEPKKGVWAAEAIRPTQTTQVFTIAYEELKEPEKESGLGKKQSIFKTIADETNTTISRSVSKDKSVTVTVSGKVQNVQEARKRLQVALQTQTTQEIPIPKELHRFIVGKEAKILKEIEANTSTSIRVPPADNPKTTVSVTGTLENVRKAAVEMQAIADEKAKLDTVRLAIRHDFHSLVQANMKPITEATGVRVSIPPAAAQKDEIVVSGEKPHTATAAAQIMALYEKLRTTCGVLVTNVKKSQHRYLIGPKGAAINEIFRATGVVVEVPGQETETEQVTLRGPTANLTAALALVFEKANSHVSEIITIPSWLHRHVIGRGGSNLKSFQEQAPKVRVDFEKDGDDITLDGPPEEVAVLKTMLLTLAGELTKVLTHLEKKVDPKHHPHLIGKGGSTIAQIRDETGAEINFGDPKEKGSSNVVSIVGNEAAVKKASAMIDDMVRKMENMRSVDIIVPQKFHAQLIGAQGATIKGLTEQFASISINMPRGDSEIVVVRGDKKDVEGAEKAIQKLLKQFVEESFQLEVPVFKEFHRQIIGRSGANIRQVSEETSTRIKFPDEDSDSNVVVITGKQKNCETARDRLLKMQGELANVVSEDLDIEARFHAAMIGPQGRVINSIMTECGGVHIHFPHGADKAARPNKVVVRGPKDDVKKATGILKEMATAELLNHHTEEVRIKREFLRFLVGRNNAERIKLEKATGARLYFPRNAEGLAPAADDDLITIVGKKEACLAAKEKLQARVKQLESITEGTVSVDPTYYRDLLANRGRFLRDLAEEFGGVSVVLPKSEGEGKYTSDVVTLKGSKEDVPKAIDRIKQFVEDVKSRVTKELQVPGSAIPAIMGSRGVNVNRISSDFAVNIKLPERKRDDSNGPAAAAGVEGGAAAAAAAPAPVATEDGDGAAAGEEEGEATTPGVEPATPVTPAGEKMETVLVTGTPANCDKAIEALLALVPVKEAIEVDPKHFPGIIGKKGETVAKLSADSGARINLPKKGNVVTIKGVPSAIALAKEKLAALVADLEARNFTATVEVDAKYHAALVGNKGVGVNEFRTKYNVNLTFPRSKGNKAAEAEAEAPEEGAEVDEEAAAAAAAAAEASNQVVITGYPKDVEEARKALLEKVKEMESQVTLELSIDPRVHNRLIGARGAAAKALQDKHKVRIIFPREKDSWTILVVGHEDGAEQAKEALELSADDFLQDILEEEHMQQYVKPTVRGRESGPDQRQQSAPFQVRNAPWDASSDFPALGGAAAAPPVTAPTGRAPTWVRRS